MQAYVDKGRRDPHRRYQTSLIVEAEPGIVADQSIAHPRHKPTAVAEFEGVAAAPGQGVEKYLQSGKIDFEARRQLKQEGTDLLSQQEGDSQEAAQGRLGILKALAMSDVLACLESKPEAGRSRRRPVPHGPGGWELVEGVINFDRREMAGVIGQIILGPEIGWLEDVPPMLVLPAGGADESAHGAIVQSITDLKPHQSPTAGNPHMAGATSEKKRAPSG